LPHLLATLAVEPSAAESIEVLVMSIVFVTIANSMLLEFCDERR